MTEPFTGDRLLKKLRAMEASRKRACPAPKPLSPREVAEISRLTRFHTARCLREAARVLDLQQRRGGCGE